MTKEQIRNHIIQGGYNNDDVLLKKDLEECFGMADDLRRDRIFNFAWLLAHGHNTAKFREYIVSYYDDLVELTYH